VFDPPEAEAESVAGPISRWKRFPILDWESQKRFDIKIEKNAKHSKPQSLTPFPAAVILFLRRVLGSWTNEV
jgi:hypothetical protein